MFLIVGQGNPGLQYAQTKHNVGFRVLERLGMDYRLKGRGLVLTLPGGLALKPTTFYNATGEAVAPLVRFYKVPPERLLVVHDELDLPPGRLRFKQGGGTAGNYGLESIAQWLGTRDFHRLRIGVGKPPSREEGAGWVLTGFAPPLLSLMEQIEKRAAEAALCWANEGMEVAQQRYNGTNLDLPQN